MSINKQAEARVGRSNQRYNPDTGLRMVAGCICLDEARDKVIMILSSVHKGKWVLPKGGIELDEGDDYVVSAVRETWEEAGCEGNVVRKLPVVYDARGAKAPVAAGEFDPAKVVPKLEFHFYEMIVKDLLTTWPEQHTRERRWCTYSEAKHELAKSKRPELIAALELSSIVRDDAKDY
jgi:diphosphoinositol-polyphosphate diphosphatase